MGEARPLWSHLLQHRGESWGAPAVLLPWTDPFLVRREEKNTTYSSLKRSLFISNPQSGTRRGVYTARCGEPSAAPVGCSLLRSTPVQRSEPAWGRGETPPPLPIPCRLLSIQTGSCLPQPRALRPLPPGLGRGLGPAGESPAPGRWLTKLGLLCSGAVSLLWTLSSGGLGRRPGQRAGNAVPERLGAAAGLSRHS